MRQRAGGWRSPGTYMVQGEGDGECQIVPRLGRMRSEKSVDFSFRSLMISERILVAWLGQNILRKSERPGMSGMYHHHMDEELTVYVCFSLGFA